MKVIAHLSGGFDSAASTLLVAETGATFKTLLIDLGQPYAEQEIKAARAFSVFLAQKYNNYQGHHILSVDMALSQAGEVSAYIPVRNLVIGAMSANLALALGYDAVAVGNKTLELRPEDPYCFNDCSREFYDKLGGIATFASQGKHVEFLMPLIDPIQGPLSKRAVVELVAQAGYDPRLLWSCYNAAERPCGECHHCHELKDAGVWDLVA